MGTLKELKKTMRSDEELKEMLVRSSLHELLIDLDGDKIADIALVDNNRDGDIDTIAIDTTGNGDFNLYMGDVDGNGVIDTVEFYKDGWDMPEAAYFGKNVEEEFLQISDRIYSIIVAKEYVKENLIDPFREFVASAIQEYNDFAQSETSETSETSEE